MPEPVGGLTSSASWRAWPSVDAARSARHRAHTPHFGARAATTAVCIGPAIKRDASAVLTRPRGKVDRVLGFQAAFSLQRFKKERLIFFYEDVYFPDDCGRSRSIVLTTSRYDSAPKSIAASCRPVRKGIGPNI